MKLNKPSYGSWGNKSLQILKTTNSLYMAWLTVIKYKQTLKTKYKHKWYVRQLLTNLSCWKEKGSEKKWTLSMFGSFVQCITNTERTKIGAFRQVTTFMKLKYYQKGIICIGSIIDYNTVHDFNIKQEQLCFLSFVMQLLEKSTALR